MPASRNDAEYEQLLDNLRSATRLIQAARVENWDDNPVAEDALCTRARQKLELASVGLDVVTANCQKMLPSHT
jgi:hypothetical protein